MDRVRTSSVIQSPQGKPTRSMAGNPGMTTAEFMARAKMEIKQYSTDHNPIRWSQAHMYLSEQYVRDVFASSGPTRAADKGIEHIEEALKVITEESDAPHFAKAHNGLAHLYPQRVAGNRTENLTKALACAETSLRVCNKNPLCPLHAVADLHEIIGYIFAHDNFESSNSRAANDDLAIRHYLASLERSSMYDDNDEWAHRQRKIGLRYYKRTNGKRRSNLKVAIKHWLEALKVFTKSEHRNDWAKTHKYLAMSYGQLIPLGSLTEMSKERNAEEQSRLVEKIIASSTNALQVFTPTYDPTAW
jgi:tetratricopeptide (TPR) repeat protein